MTIRLRYLGHDLEVPEGDFVIGRSSACQLSVDDALVSRRHALISAKGEGLTVEDLGSRNGVIVNGKRIKGPAALTDGDTIQIGGQSMTIHGLHEKAQPNERHTLLDTMSSRDSYPGDITMAHGRSPAFVAANPTAAASPISDAPDRRVHELSLIGAVAEKALGLNRVEDAARLLQRPLKEMLGRARRIAHGENVAPVEDAAARRAVQLALRLAAASNDGEWIDFVFDLAGTRRELLQQSSVDELYGLVRKTRIDLAKLKEYIGQISSTAGVLTHNEKFLLSRIEGLVEIARLK